MRIVFVRHGEPDYARDCLTENGREQAMAAAKRLRGEGIEAIYSSPLGRAAETAADWVENGIEHAMQLGNKKETGDGFPSPEGVQ